LLVRKSLRSMSAELLAIFVLQTCLILARSLSVRGDYAVWLSTERTFDDLSVMTVYLFPALFLFALNNERQNGTLNQQLSLPVARSMMLAARLLAVIMTMIVFFIFVSLAFHVKYNTASPSVMSPFPRFVLVNLFKCGSDPFVILCLITFSWGFAQCFVTKRFAAGLIAGSLGFVLYKWFAWSVGGYDVVTDYVYRKDALSSACMMKQALVTLIPGGIIAGIGMFLYERYGEV